jgi:D-3-phosphoglycerate dehydrogenase / 2-oxoglutarate reductase
MPSVLIADCDHASLDPERRLLEAAGVELRVGGGGDADVLVVQYATVDGALLDRMPSCRAVVRYGVGVDTVDVEAATARGVWVVNVPDYGTEEVADHTIALMLALLRGVVVLTARCAQANGRRRGRCSSRSRHRVTLYATRA